MASQPTTAALSSAFTLAVAGGLAMAFAVSNGATQRTPGASPQFVASERVTGGAEKATLPSQGAPLSVATDAAFEPTASRRKSRRVRPQHTAKSEELPAPPVTPATEPPVPAQDAEAPSSPVRSVTPPLTTDAKAGIAKSSDPRQPPVDAKSAEPDQRTGLPVLNSVPEKTVWSDAEVIAALRQCLSLLAPLDVEILPAEPVRNGACGDAAPVKIKSIGKSNKVSFEPPVEVNCELAARLAGWVDASLQPAAREVFSSPVTKIQGASGYSCRNRYGLSDAPLSEHATGNAVDIPIFVLANGKSVRIAAAWGPTARDLEGPKAAGPVVETLGDRARPKEASNKDASSTTAKREPPKGTVPAAESGESRNNAKVKVAADLKGVQMRKLGAAIPVQTAVSKPPPTPEGLFLRRLARDACQTFGTVLGPEANEAHRDHFHFDIKARRRKAYCQ